MKPCILFLILLTLRCLPLLGQTGYTQEGNASYYADKFHGRTTASGERYDTGKNTCAHMVLPYGTMLKVTNLGNGKSTIVRVNDRGPFAPNRIIDLSRKAAEEIDLVRTGVAKVRIETVAATAEPQPAAQTTAETPTASTPEKEPAPAREATPEPPASTSTPAAGKRGSEGDTGRREGVLPAHRHPPGRAIRRAGGQLQGRVEPARHHRRMGLPHQGEGSATRQPKG